MTITKVKYEGLFPTGSYLNEKIGFEAEIGTVPSPSPIEGMYPVTSEDPLAAIEQLRKLAEQSHKAKYPHFYSQENFQAHQPMQRPSEIPVIDHGKQTMIDIINDCATVDELEKQINSVEKYDLWNEYNAKYSELEKKKL